MSKARKIILICLVNITIVLWLVLIYSVLTHKEDDAIINYQTMEDLENSAKKIDSAETDKKNGYPGF